MRAAGLAALALSSWLSWRPTLVAAAVWAPTVARNLVPEVAVADPVVEDARKAPSDTMLEELGGST